MRKLLLGFRFGVHFYSPKNPRSRLEVRFQKVSGLSTTVPTRQLGEGGLNLYQHHLPEPITQGKLTLERGMLAESKLSDDVHDMLATFKFKTMNVLIELYDDTKQTVAAWMFYRALPVSWKTSPFDATQGAVFFETLEFAYGRMQVMKE